MDIGRFCVRTEHMQKIHVSTAKAKAVEAHALSSIAQTEQRASKQMSLIIRWSLCHWSFTGHCVIGHSLVIVSLVIHWSLCHWPLVISDRASTWLGKCAITIEKRRLLCV